MVFLIVVVTSWTIFGLVFLGVRVMQEVTKTPELELMLEEIRKNHIDIIPIILDELKDILPQYIEEIVYSIYANLTGELK